MKTAYLSLGTNLGDRLQNLTDAVQMLNASDGISVVRISSVYQTDPVGYEDQDVFF
ncbi:2-amino-4-hydroxy-6- hydroxymethyldihydropteridine pyrophosphokinase [Listeria aquatica FSL S10-1188]|uniref:2-amino-4-hydroxy-6-hydroxymethyldihydropteridine diphosphokinase n=1 Tax=Listeria aquatica FSL S10-1188 TaxID=1265818 RepID=W7ASS7_9LIST|nr:2-amino-4-hydroxy-6- hydroxymethyldihydropteridine pyrophosphokinase [Listeria aquatica FSL S10-1188]